MGTSNKMLGGGASHSVGIVSDNPSRFILWKPELSVGLISHWACRHSLRPASSPGAIASGKASGKTGSAGLDG